MLTIPQNPRAKVWAFTNSQSYVIWRGSPIHRSDKQFHFFRGLWARRATNKEAEESLIRSEEESWPPRCFFFYNVVGFTSLVKERWWVVHGCSKRGFHRSRKLQPRHDVGVIELSRVLGIGRSRVGRIIFSRSGQNLIGSDRMGSCIDAAYHGRRLSVQSVKTVA
jgi:hypothetical protein